MRRAITRSLLFAVVLLLSAPGTVSAQNDAACFITKANQDRAARGLSTLAQDATLTSIAQTHANEMAATKRAFPIENETIIKQVPAGARLVGQNVGTGTTCDAIHANFLAIPAEQNRLLDARYDKIGVGVASRDGILYVHEVLMQSGPPPASPAPSPSPTAAASPSPKPSPTSSPAASPTPAEASPSPSPTESPVESPSPVPSPRRSPTPASAADEGSGRGPLLIAFGLLLVAAAALGALVQSRRSKKP